jgi:hypothetical protein
MVVATRDKAGGCFGTSFMRREMGKAISELEDFE